MNKLIAFAICYLFLGVLACILPPDHAVWISQALGQTDESIVSETTDRVKEGTGLVSTLKNFISEIVALISLVVGLPTALGFARKRQNSKQKEITGKEAILDFIKENAATMPEDKLERMVTLMKRNT